MEDKFWNHRWDDISYHGSPDYQCDFCKVMDHDPKAKLSCPKAEKVLKKEAAEKLQKEKYEYERKKAEIKRFIYLKNKFEPDVSMEGLINLMEWKARDE